MQDDKKGSNERPESYPRPTERDNQLKNQTEYIDQKPNDYESNQRDASDVREKEKTKEPSDPTSY